MRSMLSGLRFALLGGTLLVFAADAGVHEVRSGDTLRAMCFEAYGSSGYFTEVARVNNLTDFRQLEVGTMIVFPPLGEADECGICRRERAEAEAAAAARASNEAVATAAAEATGYVESARELLGDILSLSELSAMEPLPGFATSPGGLTVHTLADPGRDYAVYLSGRGPAELRVKLAQGTWDVTWVASSGEVMKTETHRVEGDAITLASPNFDGGIAARITTPDGGF